MAIITLTTDYGNKDYYVSSLKAKLISNIENVNIVDISHNISPFNLAEAGYVLQGAFEEFPKIWFGKECDPTHSHKSQWPQDPTKTWL